MKNWRAKQIMKNNVLLNNLQKEYTFAKTKQQKKLDLSRAHQNVVPKKYTWES